MVYIRDSICINYLRTWPCLRVWYFRYADNGMEIISVHTPEFTFAHDPCKQKMYTLISNPDVRRPEICLTVEEPGLTFYPFSFGSRLAINMNN